MTTRKKRDEYTNTLPPGTIPTPIFELWFNQRLGRLYEPRPWWQFWKPRYRVIRCAKIEE